MATHWWIGYRSMILLMLGRWVDDGSMRQWQFCYLERRQVWTILRLVECLTLLEKLSDSGAGW